MQGKKEPAFFQEAILYRAPRRLGLFKNKKNKETKRKEG